MKKNTKMIGLNEFINNFEPTGNMLKESQFVYVQTYTDKTKKYIGEYKQVKKYAFDILMEKVS